MKQLCPECLKTVDVPDGAAGTDVPCPVCGGKIPVPKNYAPAVSVSPADRPPPPPGLAPPAGPLPAAGPVLAPTPTAFGDGKDVGVTLAPSWVDWVAPVGLTLVLVLTFFTWVGSYPGGHRLFAQSGWDSFLREINPNMVPGDMKETEKRIDNLTPANWLMLPYLILLIVTVVLAWAEKGVKQVDYATLPGPLGFLRTVWPQRFALLTLLSVLLLGLLLVQSVRGFGLETAVRKQAAVMAEKDASAAETSAERTTVQVKTGFEQARFAVQTTTWYALVLAAHVLVVLALFVRVWLTRRGAKPFPRLALRY